MKRIQSACLMQTIVFRAKDETLPVEQAHQLAQAETDLYLSRLDHCKTAYRIEERSEQPDGSVLLRIQRQYNSYPTGAYLK